MGSRNAENDRTVASFQVHRRPIHAVIETIQEEGASGKGAIKAPGAGTAGSWGRRDSDREVVGEGSPSRKERPWSRNFSDDLNAVFQRVCGREGGRTIQEYLNSD